MFKNFQPSQPSDHCCFCRKPDPGAAPVQLLPVWTSGLCGLRGERPLLLRWGSYRIEDPIHSPGHHPIVPFLSPQTADSSACWVKPVSAPEEWISLIRAPGAPFVMTAGTWTMPAWCADSWAVDKPSMPPDLLTSERDQGPSGWTTWSAQERSPTCGSALPGGGGDTTADTRKTRESFAQVSTPHCPQAGGGESPGGRGSEPWGRDVERTRVGGFLPLSLTFQQMRRRGAFTSSCSTWDSGLFFPAVFPGRAVSHSFHVKAGLFPLFPVVVQSGDPVDVVMKAQTYSVQFCMLGVWPGYLWANIPVSIGLSSSWRVWRELLSQPFLASVWPHSLSQSPLSSSSDNILSSDLSSMSHLPLNTVKKRIPVLQMVGLRMWLCICMLSFSVMSDPLWPHGL